MISLDVSTAMTAPVRTIAPDSTAVAAAREMRESGIGALVVLDEADELAGIVTQSDVIGLIASGADVAGSGVEDIMSAPVVTVDSDALVLDAAELMKERSVRRLPVIASGADSEGETAASGQGEGGTAEGTLVGIVTTTDLAHYLPRLRNTILRERSGKNTVDTTPDTR